MEIRNKLLFELEPVEPIKDVPIENPVKVDYKAGTYIGTAQLVYKFLDDLAIETDDGRRVYKGTMKPVAQQMGISNSYMFSVTRVLLEEGCIVMLRKGAGGKASIYEIVHPLEDVVLEEEHARVLSGKSMSELREIQLRQVMREVRELRAKVNRLEAALER